MLFLCLLSVISVPCPETSTKRGKGVAPVRGARPRWPWHVGRKIGLCPPPGIMSLDKLRLWCILVSVARRKASGRVSSRQNAIAGGHWMTGKKRLLYGPASGSSMKVPSKATMFMKANWVRGVWEETREGRGKIKSLKTGHLNSCKSKLGCASKKMLKTKDDPTMCMKTQARATKCILEKRPFYAQIPRCHSLIHIRLAPISTAGRTPRSSSA